jgi:predicted transcriptional regulator
MASTTIKSTYALDVETVRTLDRMARALNVSKSEALRRAIREAARELKREDSAVVALDALQRRLRLTPARARRWRQEIERERLASSSRSERRGR